ncbi:MAG: hypothetical protein K5886_12495 [Lachnospiraceae bacterium]|nr:hypothetical protein [Lachnospiraceae bacterium]
MLLGVSNQYFYYTRTGNSSFECNLKIEFNEKVHQEKFKGAACRALKLYPELSARTVIKDKKLSVVPNDEPPVFIPDDGTRITLGGDASNGHLFYFRMGEHSAAMPFYHGLTDAHGALTYLKTVLLFYYEDMGYDIGEENKRELLKVIRVKEEDIPSGDENDRWDPYRKYGDPLAKPEWSYDFPKAFGMDIPLYPEGGADVHKYVAELKTSDFLAKTKEHGVSFVPYLVDVVSGGIHRHMKAGSLPVVTMVPADMRSLFGTQTLVNFSDAMFFPWYEEYEKLSVQERCDIIKSQMMKQRQADNFRLMMAGKCSEVDGLIGSDRLSELTGEKPAAEKKAAPAPRRLTYAISYPGKMDLGYGFDEKILDFYCDVTVNTSSIIVMTYRDSMKILVIQRSDDRTFPETIIKALEDAGIPASLRDLSLDRPDILDFDALKRV